MEFDVHLPADGDQMLSRLEEISLLHALPYVIEGQPIVFSTRFFRIAAGQWPYEVSQARLPTQDGKIDTGALPSLIEQNYAATVLLYRERANTDPYSYFLPPANMDDPYRRALYVPDRHIAPLLAAYE